jgi:hypothetical protein
VDVAMEPGDASVFIREQGGPEQLYFELLRTTRRLPADFTVLGYEVVVPSGLWIFIPGITDLSADEVRSVCGEILLLY